MSKDGRAQEKIFQIILLKNQLNWIWIKLKDLTYTFHKQKGINDKQRPMINKNSFPKIIRT